MLRVQSRRCRSDSSRREIPRTKPATRWLLGHRHRNARLRGLLDGRHELRHGGGVGGGVRSAKIRIERVAADGGAGDASFGRSAPAEWRLSLWHGLQVHARAAGESVAWRGGANAAVESRAPAV